jgi:hypothetical protein
VDPRYTLRTFVVNRVGPGPGGMADETFTPRGGHKPIDVEPVVYAVLWKKIRRIAATVFFVFFVTFVIFPGQITSLTPAAGIRNDWYIVILLGEFNVCDVIGRSLPGTYGCLCGVVCVACVRVVSVPRAAGIRIFTRRSHTPSFSLAHM